MLLLFIPFSHIIDVSQSSLRDSVVKDYVRNLIKVTESMGVDSFSRWLTNNVHEDQIDSLSVLRIQQLLLT